MELKLFFYKFEAVKQLYDWSARVWRMFRGYFVEEFAQILREGNDQVWLRNTQHGEGMSCAELNYMWLEGTSTCGCRNRMKNLYKRPEEHLNLTIVSGEDSGHEVHCLQKI